VTVNGTFVLLHVTGKLSSEYCDVKSIRLHKRKQRTNVHTFMQWNNVNDASNLPKCGKATV
jgi:hypothetical protein